MHSSTPLENGFAEGERFADERIQVDAGDEHIAAQRGIIGIREPERAAHVVDDLAGEESDLRFRPGILPVVAVARDTHPRMAHRLPDPPHAVVQAADPVTTLEIVPGRHPDVVDVDSHGPERRARSGPAPQAQPSTHSLGPSA